MFSWYLSVYEVRLVRALIGVHRIVFCEFFFFLFLFDMTTTVRQMPMVCPGHKRGVVELEYSQPTDEGVFLISGCLGK